MNLEQRVRELEKKAGIAAEKRILFIECAVGETGKAAVQATDEIRRKVNKEIERQRAEGEKFIMVMVPKGFIMPKSENPVV